MGSMFSRLMLSSCLLVFLLLTLLWQWLDFSHEASVELVQQSLHKELAEHMAHINPMLSRGVTSDAALKEAFHDFMLLGPSFEIYTLDPGGRVIAYDAPEEKILSPQVDLTRISAFLNNQALPVFGTDPRGVQQEKIFSVTELRDPAGALTGYLYVIIGGEEFDHWQSAVLARHQQQTWLVNLLISMLFALLLFALMLKFMTAPLSRLSTDLGRIRQPQTNEGPVSLPGKYEGASEVTRLATDINSLLAQVTLQHQQMKHQQQAKQDFLLHLSHDLKTPLTSLLGFIETWRLSGDDSHRDKLIDMAASSGYKLQHLLAQLLELCALENQTIEPRSSKFKLSEFLLDIHQSYQPKALARGVQLYFEGDEMEVNTDPQLLTRILNNLLDNALRYTPAGGQIAVKPAWRNKNWQLMIRDTGSGMHQHELEALTQHRPKAPSFEDQSPLPQLGVGLAIVQKLTRMLDCRIDIQSEPGKGCCVYLALEMVKTRHSGIQKQRSTA